MPLPLTFISYQYYPAEIETRGTRVMFHSALLFHQCTYICIVYLHCLRYLAEHRIVSERPRHLHLELLHFATVSVSAMSP